MENFGAAIHLDEVQWFGIGPSPTEFKKRIVSLSL
jgi:hypothetical protein